MTDAVLKGSSGANVASASPPFSPWRSPPRLDHGRVEHRDLGVVPFDLDASLFPGARQLGSLTRHYQPKHGGEAKQKTWHFILSIGENEVSHARFARIGREHWTVENKKTLAQKRHPLA